MRPYLLADDLTGAMEAAAAFHRRGWAVRVGWTAEGSGAGLRVISTDSRNQTGDAARAVLRRIMAEAGPSARLLCKKIDSTLRGPVASEIAGLIEALAPPLVVVCPANPAAGRVVREGILRVHGVPLAQTEFAADPRWPASRSGVGEILNDGGIEIRGTVPLAALRAGLEPARAAFARWRAQPGSAVVLADAETEADLAMIVAGARAADPAVALVGSGAMAEAVANATPVVRGVHPAPNDAAAPRPILFVCGTKHGLGRRQMDAVAQQSGMPLEEVPAEASRCAGRGRDLARELQANGMAGLVIPADFWAAEGTPLERIRTIIAEAARHCSIATLVATGGETAGALCVDFGIQELTLVDCAEPGVVVAKPCGIHSMVRRVVTKPGGFGDDLTWVRLFLSPRR